MIPYHLARPLVGTWVVAQCEYQSIPHKTSSTDYTVSCTVLYTVAQRVFLGCGLLYVGTVQLTLAWLMIMHDSALEERCLLLSSL